METPIKMDDLVGFTPIFGNTHIFKKHLGGLNETEPTCFYLQG